MKRLFFAACFLAAVCGNARASALDVVIARMLGTITVRAEPSMIEGRLSGCQYVFSALTQDWTYRKGQYLKVDGSISIINTGSNVGTTLKVVVNEVVVSPQEGFKLVPAAPSRAYLIGNDYQTNLSAFVASTPSDTPGALFSIFSIDPTLAIMAAAAQTNKVTIAFNKAGGDSDILLPLDLDVKATSDEGVRTHSPETGANFANCISALVKGDGG
ncbi:hypothetical protein GR205_06410 [Rhizobium leguminosarum]|uniref:hypothetical protein n=1 Tax=Rhizobium ruizarguesonis TaxID=2081791 RepID=UPI0013DF6998|nr:hypothetical protein [Rhizobium ruizarguesonis]NEJ27607.1 hypothetical protein [Rhizobium ruizarguesonis]